MQKMLHTAEEKFLVQLAKEYPTVAAASSEIINLQAILRLPKPTEHFMSDLHGVTFGKEELKPKTNA